MTKTPPPGRSTPSRAAITWRPSLATVLVGAVALAIAVVGAVTGGFGGFLVIVALFGAGAGIWTLATGQPGWLNLTGKRSAGTIVVAVSATAFLIGAIALPHGTSAPAAHNAEPAAAVATTSAPPTPTPTPTPVSTPVAACLGLSGVDAEGSLRSSGFAVEKRAADGSAPSDWTDWIVTDQQPTAGTALAAGSTVVLVLSPPAPPVVEASAPPPAAPAPVDPAPAPEPAPADPAPVDPAPVDPAPAPVADTIKPGAFCPDASVGSTGVAANGKTYTCGGKGPDANGHYHWNAP